MNLKLRPTCRNPHRRKKAVITSGRGLRAGGQRRDMVPTSPPAKIHQNHRAVRRFGVRHRRSFDQEKTAVLLGPSESRTLKKRPYERAGEFASAMRVLSFTFLHRPR